MTESPGSELDPIEGWMAACLGAPPGEQARRFEELCAQRPEHAEELRRRMRALEQFGFTAAGPTAGLPEELGDFRLLAELGQGGMGLVLRARQRSLERDVALKLIRPELLFLPGARERFRREVDAIARLKHPGIVPVHAVGEHHGLPYFAMELVEGATLATCLTSLAAGAPERLHGRDLARALERATGAEVVVEPDSIFERSWSDACIEIARQVADALAHAHGRGLLHRDVKPSNVMLSLRGRAMLVDFGLTSAQENDRLTRSGAQLGTLLYMSPEQVRGDKLDVRSDVYSLGATLYELLTLEPPFERASRAATQQAILLGETQPVRARNRAIDSDAQTVCRVAMELEPARRYLSALAFARDLANVLARRPIEARPPGVGVRLARWVRRHPAKSVGGLAAAAIAIGVPTALLVQKSSYARTLEDSLQRERTALEDAESTLMYLNQLMLSGRDRGLEQPLRAVLERGVASIDELARRPTMQARALYLIADSYRALGEYDAALPLFERALAIDAANHGRASQWTLLSTNALATALQRKGDVVKAIELFERALAGQIELRGQDHVAVAAAHNNLAAAQYDAKSFDAAATNQRRALEIYERDGPPSHKASVVAALNLANLLIELGRRDEVVELLARCRPRIQSFYPPGDAERGTMLNLAGNAANATGELELALALLDDALASVRQCFGERHPDLPPVMFNRGRVLEKQGRRDEALESYRAAERMMDDLAIGAHPMQALIRAARERLERELGSGD